jgi:hypothetical protein
MNLLHCKHLGLSWADQYFWKKTSFEDDKHDYKDMIFSQGVDPKLHTVGFTIFKELKVDGCQTPPFRRNLKTSKPMF